MRLFAHSLATALSVVALSAGPAAAQSGGTAPAPVPSGGQSSTSQAPDSPGNGWITGDDLLGVGGSSGTTEPLPPAGPRPTVPGSVVAVSRTGLAFAPARAPYRVKLAIWAANQLRKKPYKWGGGHRGWSDSGYDCSGSVSYVLHAAGLLGSPLDSGGFTRWGARGAGRWITIYANKGHVFMVIAGVRFDTSGLGEKGPRWRPYPRSASRFKVRHAPGL